VTVRSPYARLEAALGDVGPPSAVVDLDAFRADAADLARRAAGKPIRRALRVYRRRAKAGERFDSLPLLDGDRVVDEVPTSRGEGEAFL
jgi:D-serine deaminase-like pyridoxal phosphate-dependent protein